MGFVNSIFGGVDKYNATPAQLQTNDYTKYIQQLLGNNDLGNAGAANNTAGQQGQLAQMLMQQAQGNGPSPAQALLTQATNQNTQAAGAQLAGVRGMNPAAAARLILQNNATAQQQAANQSAQLKANEQLGAQSQLGNVLGTQRGQDISQGQSNANLIGTLGQLQNSQNATNVQNVLGANQINAGVSSGNASMNAGIAGGVLGGGAAAASSFTGGGGKYKGGMIGYDEGGDVQPDNNFIQGGPMDEKAPVVDEGASAPIPANAMPTGAVQGAMAGAESGGAFNWQNMQVPNAGPAPQANYMPTNKYAQGYAIGSAPAKMAGSVAKLMFLKQGGQVPGQAGVSGDSPSNDTVPAMLSPGEAVLPRSVTQSEDAPEKAKEFMAALKRNHKSMAGSPQGYAAVLQSHRRLSDRLAQLERMCGGGMAK